MTASRVMVLSYHRIAVPGNPDLSDALIDAYPADFEAQMRYLSSHYPVVSSWDIVRSITEGYTLPHNAVAITFDDGYTCFLDTVMPVMRRLSLPVTLFVTTEKASAGGLFWWDELYRSLLLTARSQVAVEGLGAVALNTQKERLEAYSRLVYYLENKAQVSSACLLRSIVEQCGVAPTLERYLLDWEQLQSLEAEGVTIGPHTRRHPILAQSSAEQVQAETAGSWQDLQNKLRRPLPIFCYPNGRAHAVNRVAVGAVKQAGMVGAFTTVPGLNTIGKTNPYLMYRVGGTAGETLRHFTVKLSPPARAYRLLKRLVSRAQRQVRV